MDTSTNSKKQVKFVFNGLIATVSVNGSNQRETFDIASLSDEMKLELLQLGAKTKLSNYRCGDKLYGDEKVATIKECYQLLTDNIFRQVRAKAETMSIEDQTEAWLKMSEDNKLIVKSVAPEKYKKLNLLNYILRYKK